MTWFFGITIGPIYGTMSLARDTGGLWAASYLFSYISECLVAALGQLPGVHVFSPAPGVNRSNKRAGAFSDRIYFTYAEDREIDSFLEELEKVKGEVIIQIAEDVLPSIDPDEYSGQGLKERARHFLNRYLQVYYVGIDSSSLNGEPPLKKLNMLLDAAELRPPYLSKHESPYLTARFLNNETVKKSHMFGRAFGVDKFVFPSLTDIARTEIRKEGKSVREVVVEKLSASQDFQAKTKKDIPKFANYYALVRVDGDFIGRYISSLDEIDEITNTSRRLLEYAGSASEMIEKYGGFPVYAGGDDLMFFAPLIGWGETGDPVPIIRLLRALDELFKKYVGERFSLSFGLAVTYHKYPLYEALDMSQEQLNKAKGYKTKNAVGICLQTHSGQGAELVLSLKDESILGKIETLWNPLAQERVESLQSIERKLRERSPLLLEVLRVPDSQERDSRISWWFAQEFEEDRASLGLVRDIVKDILLANVEEFSSLAEAIERTEAILSFARFMREHEEENYGD